MKLKQLFFNACIIGTILSYQLANAQNDLVVFSNNGERFYLYVNGVKQNPDFETNVRVTNIKQPQVKLRVVFEDNKKIPDLYTNAMLMWEGEEKKGWEFVYQIVNKAGKYKIKPYSAAEIHRESTGDQTVVNYSNEEPAPNISVTSPANTNVSLNTQTVTSTSVTTTNSAAQSPRSNSPNGAVGINISLSPNSAGIQIHDDGTTNNSSTSYTTSVVSTTVVSSSSTASENENTAAPTTPATHPKPRTVVKCAVSDTEFENIKKSINSKSFEDSKLTVAKQICDSKCLKSSQVRDIMKLFSFEQTRLDFAKYAYKNVIDKENYYQVNDAFQFENSIEELNESIGK